jgi:hypothetical protein
VDDGDSVAKDGDRITDDGGTEKWTEKEADESLGAITITGNNDYS